MKRTWMTVAVAMTASCLPLLAAAQSYPSRPVKIVVPFAAGSGSDIVGPAVRSRASMHRETFNEAATHA